MNRDYDRDKLYNEVWDKPMTVVAVFYGVSDVAIKKICKKLNIPTPERGYWQKVKAGARMDRPPLPKFKGVPVARNGNTEEYENYHQKHEAVKEKVAAKAEKRIIVSEQLRNPHPLVEQAYEKLKKLWARSRDKDPVWHLSEDALDIRISKSSAHRGLCIMDAVIKDLVSEGYSIGLQKGWGKHTFVTIDGEAIYFRLHERVKQVPHVKTTEEMRDEKRGYSAFIPIYDHLPSGMLTLTIEYHRYLPKKNWADTEKHKIEDCLDEFIQGLKVAAAHARIETEKDLVAEQVRMEAEERRQIAAELRAKEIEKFEELEKLATEWHRTQIIKDYVLAMEAAIDACMPEDEADRRREYITWARDKIDWLNPLIAKEDPILGGRKRQE